jgi:hypothetical protein
MIIRTYRCEQCGYGMEVQLRSDQWNAEPPDCPQCARILGQEFAPPAIVGSNLAKATKTAEEIMRTDYGVADFRAARREGERSQVRYNDQSEQSRSQWGTSPEVLNQAIALGRETRQRYGSGLDVLQRNLKSGAQPDLIEISKRRSMSVW